MLCLCNLTVGYVDEIHLSHSCILLHFDKLVYCRSDPLSKSEGIMNTTSCRSVPLSKFEGITNTTSCRSVPLSKSASSLTTLTKSEEMPSRAKPHNRSSGNPRRRLYVDSKGGNRVRLDCAATVDVPFVSPEQRVHFERVFAIECFVTFSIACQYTLADFLHAFGCSVCCIVYATSLDFVCVCDSCGVQVAGTNHVGNNSSKQSKGHAARSTSSSDPQTQQPRERHNCALSLVVACEGTAVAGFDWSTARASQHYNLSGAGPPCEHLHREKADAGSFYASCSARYAPNTERLGGLQTDG